MPYKTQTTDMVQTFSFLLSHDDVVKMMNDPDVKVAGGTVSENQVMEIWVERCNGSERFFYDNFKNGEKLVIRFRSPVLGTDETELGQPDVDPV